ncbi:MAG: Mediator of RNA polymerase II transcription subunit 6 [Chaenotheca gracillima]|nr:MAG: Mediator of RNA polymerase II transcription subunit 6 [Chaenotheca gracillima]
MAAGQDSLDEISWGSSELAQSMGGIHTNSILPYFSRSPFFDATSNNASLMTQATYNQSMFHLLQTREAFEGRLRSMQGLEYMVVSEPAPPMGPDDETGAWVIQKQTRRRTPGSDAVDLTVLNTYFVVEVNIYPAPSIGGVLGARLLSSVSSLTKFLSTASSLPKFTPAMGHTYIRPQPNALTSIHTTQSTRASKETTPLPDSLPRLNSVSQSQPHLNSAATNMLEARSISESLAMSLRYGGEYMDENPLTGEPGSFVLSSSQQHLQHLRAPVSGSSKPATTVTPQAQGQGSPTASAKKGSKAASGSTSPITAAAAAPAPAPAPPKPKRRKSKAAGVSSLASPS